MNLKTTPSRSVRVRRPEYTGENRCLPCTAVNLGLAAGLTGLAATVSPPAAAAVAAGSLASIYFRGYLVPGTPELTKRYLPERVLRWFGKAPQVPAGEVDPGVVLATAGVLVDEPDGGDVSLTPAFTADWRRRTGELLVADDDSRRLLASILGVPESTVSVADAGAGLTASLRGERLGLWESRTAFVADMAAMELLAARVPNWDRLSVGARSETTGALRLLADTCPDCAGPTSLVEGTVESCCASYPVVAVTCGDCGARLVELRVTDEMLAGDDGAAV
jgi:hypothetical protein